MCKQRVRNVTIGNDAKPHNFATATLFSEFVVMLPHLFSIVTTDSQLFSDHLSSSQFLQLFSVNSQSCSISPLLSQTLFTSSLHFSTLPIDCHLCPPHQGATHAICQETFDDC